MGLETPSQGLGRIDPSALIGRAETVVEPRATAILTDAFRQGVVTADDVLSRIGELGKAKRKAEIDVAGAQSMQAQEATSPEAQAARAGQLDLQNQQIEKQKILIQYPAIAYFEKFAPSAGIEAPVLPDGTPDYKEMERIGAELAVHESERAKASEQLANITTKDSADGSTLFAVTKQGEFVDPKTVQALRAKATRPFQRQAPGTFAAPAVVEPKPQQITSATPLSQNTELARAQVASQVPSDPAADAARAAAASGMVTPRVATPQALPEVGVAPVGAPVPGGVSLGPPKPGLPKAPTEAQQRAQLALSRFAQAGNMQAALQEAGYDPTSIGSWMNSMLPQIIKSGDRKQYEAAVDAWSQGLLRLESGAAISRQEKSWYDKAFFPQVRDPENVVLAKESMRHDIERMVAEIAQQGGVVSPESVEQANQIYARAGNLVSREGATQGGGASPVVTLPSGKKVRRNANGSYTVVQ